MDEVRKHRLILHANDWFRLLNPRSAKSTEPAKESRFVRTLLHSPSRIPSMMAGDFAWGSCTPFSTTLPSIMTTPSISPLKRLRPCLCTALVFLALLLPSTIGAQSPWVPATMPPTGGGMSIVYDTARSVVVAYFSSSGETHEWDGRSWRLAATTGPSTGASVALAYANSRSVTVLFNGTTGATWQWAGASWTKVATSGPSTRQVTAMSYDLRRDRVVLHGGSFIGVPSTYFNDTWEWDFTNWNQVSSSGPTTAQHAMTYDQQRGHTLLYGGGIGLFGSVVLRETWSWDGKTWTRLATSGPPNGRGPMSYDPSTGRMILIVKGGAMFAPAETWEWNGTSWSWLAAMAWGFDTVPNTELCFDIARGVTLGFTSDGAIGSWNHVAWTYAASALPRATRGPGVAFDTNRGRFIQFGGSGGYYTSEWDGHLWHDLSTAGPSRHRYVEATFDPIRKRVVAFSGPSHSLETWEWDGSTWTLANAGGLGTPYPRRGCALGFDPVTRRVLMSGGYDSSSRLMGDTWAWDGSTWTQLPSGALPPHTASSMATDTLRNRVVLAGGTLQNETWEWDGVSWSLSATTGPSSRYLQGMTYDAARGRTVMYGGRVLRGSTLLSDTWEWDGHDWTQLSVAGFGDREEHELFYDAVANRVVSYAGRSNSDVYSDLTVLELDSFGTGCAGTAGVPSIQLTDARPQIAASIDVALSSLPPTATSASLLIGLTPAAPSISLTSIGLPGCELHISPTLTDLSVPLSRGSGSLSIPIPNLPQLAGLRVIMQSAVVDPGANALGLAISNAVVAVIR